MWLSAADWLSRVFRNNAWCCSTYLQTDVDNAIALSGGVDSSIICFSALDNGMEVDGFTKVASGIDEIADNVTQMFEIQLVSFTSRGSGRDELFARHIRFISSAAPPRWGTAPSMMPLYEKIGIKGNSLPGWRWCWWIVLRYQTAIALANTIKLHDLDDLKKMALYSFSSQQHVDNFFR